LIDHWYKNAIIYAIEVRTFADGNGDDGYDVQDYYGVNPRYGSFGEFVDFMHEANEHGIRVFVDLVVNHTSNQHPWFQSARSDPNSPYRDWYIWSEDRPKDAQSGVGFPGVQKSTWTYDRGFRVDAAPFMIEDKTRKMLPAGPPQYHYLVEFRRFLQ
jgi:maltose alpha-D-glucosyltransferase/alpha-amylase